MIYLDNSATTRVLPEAAARAGEAMEREYGNPAAAYGFAARIEKEVETARATLARTFHAGANEIVYTSGGTESNNMAIFGAVGAGRGKRRILTTAVEHPSVYEVFRHLEQEQDLDVRYLPVHEDGSLCLSALGEALSPDTALVSVMHVNNELGTVNDLGAIASLVRAAAPRAVIHVDGVQAFLKIPLPAGAFDLYTVSGHKIHAPKGVGALYMRQGVRCLPGLLGGGQERGMRSGTTNVPGILGMDAAIRCYQQNADAWHARMQACKERLYANLTRLPDVKPNGPAVRDGAPHILNLSFLGVRAETLLHALEEHDILVSTGSACAAHKKGKNRILHAIGATGAREEGAIRFSFSPFNSLAEMDTAAAVIEEQVTVLRRYRRR